MAVKLPGAYGPGKDQDLLLTSSSDRPLLRRLLFPATSFVRGVFSTALPYELGGKRVVLLLVPAHTDGSQAAGAVRRGGPGALAELDAAAAGGLRFELRTASSLGPSQPVATLTTGQPLSPGQTEALRFNPWTTGPGIRPVGWLNLLRDTAYKQANAAGRADHRPAQCPSPGCSAAPWLACAPSWWNPDLTCFTQPSPRAGRPARGCRDRS